VRFGVAFDAADSHTGGLVVPTVTNVLDGVTYDVDGSSVGTVVQPDQSDVRFGVNFGDTGNTLTGACHVPAKQYVLSAQPIDQDTGTLTIPPGGKVDTTNGPYGVDGTGSTPTLNLSSYVLVSAVVSASFVVTGHDNYTGGTGGSYPTSATTAAAANAAARANIIAQKGHVEDGYAITGDWTAITGADRGTLSGSSGSLFGPQTGNVLMTQTVAIFNPDRSVTTYLGQHGYTVSDALSASLIAGGLATAL
jgi:hypothetical protein